MPGCKLFDQGDRACRNLEAKRWFIDANQFEDACKIGVRDFRQEVKLPTKSVLLFWADELNRARCI